MANTHSRRLILLGLVGLFSIASPGSAAVYCVADNGHAEIEVLASICCEDGATSQQMAAFLEPSDSSCPPAGCGPCVDLQLTSPSRLDTPSKAAAPGHSSPTQPEAISAAYMAIRTQLRPADCVPTFSPSREALASVVLLI